MNFQYSNTQPTAAAGVPWDTPAPESPLVPPFAAHVQARWLFISPLAFVGTKPFFDV